MTSRCAPAIALRDALCGDGSCAQKHETGELHASWNRFAISPVVNPRDVNADLSGDLREGDVRMGKKLADVHGGTLANSLSHV
jgi:hypothetical protein